MDLGLGDGRAEGQRGQRGEPGQIRRSVVQRSWGGKGRTIVQDPWWQKAKGKRYKGDGRGARVITAIIIGTVMYRLPGGSPSFGGGGGY
jgi:hypothetical protein